MDQSTPHRTNAAECYQRLLSKQDEFIGTRVEDTYWNAVSLELFHMGQIEAQNENNEQAREHFSKALAAAKKGFSEDWLAYIEGTLHYLDNNQAGLEQVMNRVDLNFDVLQRFLAGLQKRGAPNYKQDY